GPREPKWRNARTRGGRLEWSNTPVPEHHEYSRADVLGRRRRLCRRLDLLGALPPRPSCGDHRCRRKPASHRGDTRVPRGCNSSWQRAYTLRRLYSADNKIPHVVTRAPQYYV